MLILKPNLKQYFKPSVIYVVSIKIQYSTGGTKDTWQHLCYFPLYVFHDPVILTTTGNDRRSVFSKAWQGCFKCFSNSKAICQGNHRSQAKQIATNCWQQLFIFSLAGLSNDGREVRSDIKLSWAVYLWQGVKSMLILKLRAYDSDDFYIFTNWANLHAKKI